MTRRHNLTVSILVIALVALPLVSVTKVFAAPQASVQATCFRALFSSTLTWGGKASVFGAGSVVPTLDATLKHNGQVDSTLSVTHRVDGIGGNPNFEVSANRSPVTGDRTWVVYARFWNWGGDIQATPCVVT